MSKTLNYSKMIIAPSFLHPLDVGSAFDELSEGRQDNLLNIYPYWEDNNFGRFRRNHCNNSSFISQGTAIEDMWVISLYNPFKSSVESKDSNIYTLDDHIGRKYDLTKKTTNRILSGITSSHANRKSKYNQLSIRLTANFSTCLGNVLKSYLCGCSKIGFFDLLNNPFKQLNKSGHTNQKLLA
ncbi:hypothetical protein RF11_15099 [Thelohanellus kitauei]|uniref:Uncharacterized protein n=1 Tax=Thelohanellus kitauei TaxID=669202 RepID=A0A0C2NI53_THEKT|nr:hypothetical protein RF11_15099 [Thelohanellus kitauei]